MKSGNTMLIRLWALFVGTLVFMMSHGLQNTLISLRAEEEAFGVFLIGVIMSSYYAGHLVASMGMPAMVRRLGHVRVFAALAAIASSLTLLLTLFVDPYAWMLARALTGCAITGMLFVCESWVQSFATNKNRGFIFAIFMTHIFAGLALGQLLLLLGDITEFTLFAVVSVLFSLAVVPLLLSVKAKPKPLIIPKEKRSFRSLLNVSPIGLFGVFMIGGLHAIIYTILPVYGVLSGISTDIIALGIGLLIASGAIAQIPFGMISDKMDRRIMLLLLSVGAALAMVPLSLYPASNMLFLVTCGLAGIFVFPLYPICVSHVNDRIGSEHRLAITSVMMMVNGIGSIFLPLVTGALISLFGAKSFFWVAVAICVVLALLVFVRLLKRESAKVKQRRRWFGLPFMSHLGNVPSNNNNDTTLKQS